MSILDDITHELEELKTRVATLEERNHKLENAVLRLLKAIVEQGPTASPGDDGDESERCSALLETNMLGGAKLQCLMYEGHDGAHRWSVQDPPGPPVRRGG